MLFIRAGLFLMLLTALSTTAVQASRFHHSPTSSHSKSGSAYKKSPKKSQIKGQRQIDPDRAREIQLALVKENYLSGEPTGQWDAQTSDAMKRYQSDQGWQTKITPDSRALIKLGLGPVKNDGPVKADGVAKADPFRPQDSTNLPDETNTLAGTRSAGR